MKTLAQPLAARLADLPALPEAEQTARLTESVIDAAIAALDAGKTHYTDRPGILGLRTWVSDHLKQAYDITVEPDEVTITCGMTEARFVALTRLWLPDTHIYCPEVIPGVEAVAKLMGAQVVTQPDESVSVAYQPDLSAVLNPDWWIIWEDRNTGEHPAQQADPAKIVTLGSFSDQLPGWRMGWMAGSEKAKALRAYKQSMTICSPSISQWAALGLTEES